MKDVKQVRAMVIDGGENVDFAVSLSKGFHTTWYTTSWQRTYPTINQGKIGVGMEGIELVTSKDGPEYDSTDLFIFLDLYHGPEQERLIKQGKKVWGPRYGEKLEIDRIFLKKKMAEAGLPVGKYQVAHGITELREILQKTPNVFVKMSKWRGSMESFQSRNYEESKPEVDEQEFKLGPFAEEELFVVEHAIDEESEGKPVAEIGMDLWSVKGQFPKTCLGGAEIKNDCYLCKVMPYDAFPEALRKVNAGLAPVMRRTGYVGFFATECRNQYLIDFTARVPSPPGEILQKIPNMPEIMWAGANGVMVAPKPQGKFFAQARIQSHWAEDHWQKVTFPPEIRDHVVLTNACRVNGQYWVIPQEQKMKDIGSVVAWGDSEDEATGRCQAFAKLVEGNKLKVNTDALGEARSVLDKSKKAGYPMF